MAFTLLPTDSSIEAAVRRLARKQIRAALAERRIIAESLGDKLGRHHDLIVLSGALDQLPDASAAAEAITAARMRIKHELEQLEAEAFLLGGQLAAEKPSVFKRRFARYWLTRQSDSSRPA